MIEVIKKYKKYFKAICSCGAEIKCDESDLIKLYISHDGCDNYYQMGIKCPCCNKNIYYANMNIIREEIKENGKR